MVCYVRIAGLRTQISGTCCCRVTRVRVRGGVLNFFHSTSDFQTISLEIGCPGVVCQTLRGDPHCFYLNVQLNWAKHFLVSTDFFLLFYHLTVQRISSFLTTESDKNSEFFVTLMNYIKPMENTRSEKSC